MTQEELALSLLRMLSPRNTTYDDRQALLFLAKDGDDWTFNVLHCPGFDVSIESNHGVWLPAVGAVTGDTESTPFMITGSTSSITLSAFRAKVTELAAAKASTLEGYSECVLSRIQMEQLHSDGAVRTSYESFTIGSGLPSQVMTVSEDGPDQGYWLNGEDVSALFEPIGRYSGERAPASCGNLHLHPSLSGSGGGCRATYRAGVQRPRCFHGDCRGSLRT